jgi:hypothetical protein
MKFQFGAKSNLVEGGAVGVAVCIARGVRVPALDRVILPRSSVLRRFSYNSARVWRGKGFR